VSPSKRENSLQKAPEPVIPGRSIDAKDYQALPQPVGAMPKSFADGYTIEMHSHTRDQLLYAVEGVMRLLTGREAWIVPQGSAVYIPAGIMHAVSMHSRVEVRTLYIDSEQGDIGISALVVLPVSDLLKALIIALCEEAIEYEPDSRGDLLARLICMEIRQSRGSVMKVPLPEDKRLQKLCAAIMASPSDQSTLETWSEQIGASPRTISRLFQKELDMSFSHWRQLVRMHNALESLSVGMSVAQVAREQGYNSPSAFTFAFRKMMGIAPSDRAKADKNLVK